jgi:hypothetical protein
MPSVLAAVYALTGRSFAAWRVVNCATVALALTLAVVWAFRLAGPVAAAVTLAVSLQDTVLHRLGREFWTEGLAALLVIALALALERLARTRSARDALVCGAVLGLTWYVRTAFITWYPWVALAAAALLHERTAASLDVATPVPPGGRAGRSMRLVALLLAAAILVPLPWMIRNCLVLGAFMPNGTMYARHLPAGFSDQAIERRGRWSDMRSPGAGSELEAAEQSRARAREWIRQNGAKIGELTRMKVATEWRRWLERGPLVLIATAVGVVATIVRPFGLIALTAVLATTVCVAATWSVGGRFVAPIHPLLHVATGVGAWTMVAWPWRRLRSRRDPSSAR